MIKSVDVYKIKLRFVYTLLKTNTCIIQAAAMYNNNNNIYQPEDKPN